MIRILCGGNLLLIETSHSHLEGNPQHHESNTSLIFSWNKRLLGKESNPQHLVSNTSLISSWNKRLLDKFIF